MNDDDLSWIEAAARAWNDPGPDPILLQNQKNMIRAIHPRLARALDRASTPPRYGPPHPHWMPTQEPSSPPSL